MYFLRIDFICRDGSGVARSRELVKSPAAALEIVKSLLDSRVTVLQVKLEMCV